MEIGGFRWCRADVQNVMREVLAAIVHRLSEEYARIELKSDDAKTRYVPLISTRAFYLAYQFRSADSPLLACEMHS
jgi:vacuolar protein sorting-associated protein 54